MSDFLFDEGKNKIEGLKKTEINQALESKADAQAVANAFQSVNEALNGKASTQALNQAVQDINTALNGKASTQALNQAVQNINTELAETNEAVNVVTIKSNNIYNPANTLETSYIKTDGTIDYNANYSVSEAYLVPNGKKIILSALVTSYVPPQRRNANACRKACIYKADGTIEMLSSESTAYQYINNTGENVNVRFQLWGDGATRSATDIYIVIVDPDVVVPASVYSPYGIGISPEIIQTKPQTLTETQKSQARANIGATRTLGFSNDDFFREFSNVPNISIVTDQYTNEKIATFTGNGSSVSWVRINVPVLQSKAYILEFWGKTTDEAYYSDASQNGMVVCEFYDKNDSKIGSQKYNAYVLGTKKLGYHKYGFVSPWGASYALIRVVTRGTTIIQISNISFTQIERVMPRQDNGIIYFGHQGMKYSAPQNMIPSFELGIVAGFNSNVINPNVTSDGVLVCLHSDPIDSVSNGTGNVYDYTFEELQAFDFGSWYNAAYTGVKLPKFEEAVRLLAISGQRIGVAFHSLSFNTHMTTEKVKEACNIIKKYSYKKPLIKSFDLPELVDAYDIFGEEATYVLCLEGSNLSTKIDNLYNSALTGEIIVEFPSSNVSNELIEQVKNYNFGVSVYFGNEPTRMKELIKMGVNMFTVDTFSDVIIPMD